MKRQEGEKFANKHGSNAKIDERIKDALLRESQNNEVPCAVAFQIAEALQATPSEVGKTADLLEMELIKCQLGLFGYKPDKKIVQPQAPENTDLENVIRDSLVDGKLPCRKAWDIARARNMSKMAVSAVCEHLEIKIKPCQLGAF
ncbi:MAG: hypothetical protein R3274_01855 [Desulfobacterales bacterium]|nr:hypothetical protein [Desulfobacterales bacterium]